MTKSKIIYAFIDSQNLNLGVRSLGWKLDWRKFRQYLRNKYNVTKAFAFIFRIDLLKESLKLKKSTGIGDRSKP